MGCFHSIVVFLAFAIAASHAALLPEAYWKTVLPSTPMPKAVTNLLHPDYMQQENTEVNVGQGGVHVDAPGGTTVDVGKGHVDVDAGKGKPGGDTSVDVGKGTGVNVNTGKSGGATNVNVGRKDVGVSVGYPGGNTNVGVGRGGVSVDAGYPGGRTNVGAGEGGVSVDTGYPGGRTNVGAGRGGVSVDAGYPGGRTNVGAGRGGVSVDAGYPGGRTNVGAGRGGVSVDAGYPGGQTNVGAGRGGVSVDAGYPGGRTNVGAGKGGVSIDAGYPGGRTNVGAGGGGVSVDAGYPGGRTNVDVGRGSDTGHSRGNTNVGVSKADDSADKGHKRRHVYVGVNPDQKKNPFDYQYAATQTQLHDDPNVALFFMEKDMHPGSQMNLHFIQDSNKATFLPRQEAASIPFSSNKLPEILNEFSMQKSSKEAEIINNTIKECEAPGIKGEDKYCATSLESMIDYTTSKLGKNIRAISTEAEKETKMQKYSISARAKEMARDQAVVCHKQNYPYAVFYCHTTHTEKVYTVPLEGADGTKVKAVAVCHTNTAAWNPKHLAFQVLKVKPGTVPVCHFLPEDHIVWIPK